MSKKLTPIEEGWVFASRLSGSISGSNIGSAYVNKVNEAIDATVKSIVNLKSNQSDPSLGGFVAENWHAGTFNVNAAASGSKNIAVAGESGTVGDLGRNNYASVDVRVQTNNGKVINDYSSKYMVNAKETAKEQSRPSKIDENITKYTDQKRLVPSDQLEDVKKISEKRMNNDRTPDNWKHGYEETHETAADKITDGKITSKELSKSESEEIAREIKNDEFDIENHGISSSNAIKANYIIKQAAKAGLSSAVITALIQIAPDIYAVIDYLIRNKVVDKDLLEKTGIDAIRGSAEGFLRGFVACSIQILCDSGKLGKPLVGVNPTLVGVLVALTMQTIKDSFDVAKGKIKMKQLGANLINSAIVSAGYIAGAKIGGAIGAAIGFECPVVGFLLGSLIGTVFGMAYDFGKKKFISFCVDNGFTCFGLVEQNYSLPEEALKEMGISIIEIDKLLVDRNELDKTSIDTSSDSSFYQKPEIKILKRGIIGFNKIGYSF